MRSCGGVKPPEVGFFSPLKLREQFLLYLILGHILRREIIAECQLLSAGADAVIDIARNIREFLDIIEPVFDYPRAEPRQLLVPRDEIFIRKRPLSVFLEQGVSVL